VKKNTVDKTGGGKYKPDSFGCFGEITVAGFCSLDKLLITVMQKE